MKTKLRIYLISDNIDTLVGMRLAGIKGTVVHTREDVLKELEHAKEQDDIGIILITEKLSALVEKEIRTEKITSDKPLIVEIPDRHGSFKGEDRITSYIEKAIGLKL